MTPRKGQFHCKLASDKSIQKQMAESGSSGIQLQSPLSSELTEQNQNGSEDQALRTSLEFS